MAEVNGSLLHCINCFIFSVMTGMAVYWYFFRTEQREQPTINDHDESSSSESDTDTNRNVQTKQQKENEKDLICISVELKTEYYIRFTLLLKKCGTNVLRQIFLWGLERQSSTLSEFLSSKKFVIDKNKHITRVQRNILYPSAPKQTSVDQWDISLLCFLTIEYFQKDMTNQERTTVRKIREWRNDIDAHNANACIDEQSFFNLWMDLTVVIRPIVNKMEEVDRTENEAWMNKLCSPKLDMNTAVDKIKKHGQTDDLSKSLSEFLGDKSTIVPDFTAVIKDLTSSTKVLLNKQSTHKNPEKLDTAALTLYGVVHALGDVVDQAETALLAVCKKDRCSSQEKRKLTEAMDRFKDEIEKADAEVQNVDQGSIIFTIKCNSIAGVLDLLKVFESVQLQKCVSEIAEALTDVIGQEVHLVAYLLRQPFLELLRRIKSKESNETFIGIPTGLEGFHSVVKTFMEDGLSDKELSQALYHCVGTRVADETPIDVHQLQHDIHVAKGQQLALPGWSERVSTEEMMSENLETNVLFYKATTEERKDVTEYDLFKEPSTNSEGLQPDEDYGINKPGRTYSETNEENDQLQDIDRRLDKNRPGQPEATAILADTVTLTWESPLNFGRNDYYEISYSTDISINYNWKVYPIETKYRTAVLTGLKTKTKYVFRVRAVYINGEGPNSPNSLEITTKESLASQFLPKATKIKDEYSPATYRLPVTDVESARDEANKTKKYQIGIPPKGYVRSKTILLIGATGTGKTTLVDGITNYALGVGWKDSFRFSTVHREESEEARLENQALSQTDWITCYTINHEKGSRIKYQLHVLDTPGFGDTQGPERDKKIATQLKELFSQDEPKGITYIDAICFLVKSPDSRLTVSQKYVFDSVFSLFGKDVENNICYLITFADNNEPPVLAAIKESKLPSGQSFKFNNSGLFARNENADSDAGEMFWNMGLNSFSDFFEYLDDVEAVSLTQTNDVLDERQQLEKAVSNLQPQIDLGMSKVAELKVEKLILKKHFPSNKGEWVSEYETEEIKPQKRIFDVTKPVAKCRNCYQMCNKTVICTVKETGEERCRVCPNKCLLKDHTNVQSMYEYIPVKMKKQYSNMQQQIEQLEDELKKLSAIVEYLMVVVKTCTDRLADIALRPPNPLSIIDYIDIMIDNEKKEQRDGFQNRILGLAEIRKRTNITGEYEKFSKEVSDILKKPREAKSTWFTSVFKMANDLITEDTT